MTKVAPEVASGQITGRPSTIMEEDPEWKPVEVKVEPYDEDEESCEDSEFNDKILNAEGRSGGRLENSIFCSVSGIPLASDPTSRADQDASELTLQIKEEIIDEKDENSSEDPESNDEGPSTTFTERCSDNHLENSSFCSVSGIPSARASLNVSALTSQIKKEIIEEEDDQFSEALYPEVCCEVSFTEPSSSDAHLDSSVFCSVSGLPSSSNASALTQRIGVKNFEDVSTALRTNARRKADLDWREKKRQMSVLDQIHEQMQNMESKHHQEVNKDLNKSENTCPAELNLEQLEQLLKEATERDREEKAERKKIEKRLRERKRYYDKKQAAHILKDKTLGKESKEEKASTAERKKIEKRLREKKRYYDKKQAALILKGKTLGKEPKEEKASMSLDAHQNNSENNITIEKHVAELSETEMNAVGPSEISQAAGAGIKRKMQGSSEAKKKYEREKKRKQREKIYKNPILHEKFKEKLRASWRERVELGRVKRVFDKSEYEQQVQKRKWKEASKRHYEKKKRVKAAKRYADENTPPASPGFEVSRPVRRKNNC